jgi:hypothetical protein
LPYVKCLHPKSLKIEEYLVSGDADNPEYYHYASTMRFSHGMCGYKGNLFQPLYPIIDEVVLADPDQTRWWHYFTWRRKKAQPVQTIAARIDS